MCPCGLFSQFPRSVLLAWWIRMWWVEISNGICTVCAKRYLCSVYSVGKVSGGTVFFFLEEGGWGLKVNGIYSPVQNFGSSLPSPQSSLPSQYLSSGRHNPLGPRHANSDTLQPCPTCIRISTRRNARARFRCLLIWK